MDVIGDGTDAESTVSGRKTAIPPRIRDELGIEDGDTLCWQIEDDEHRRVRICRRRTRTFAEFDGYNGDVGTDAAAEHDDWTVDVE